MIIKNIDIELFLFTNNPDIYLSSKDFNIFLFYIFIE